MKKKKIAFHRVTALILIISTIGIPPSNGQVAQPSKIENNTPTTLNPSITTEIKDPLFFMEGQLCQHLRKIFQDSKGNLWFGTNVYDLMRYNGETLKYITKKEGFSGGRVTGIMEDKAGNLWFATGGGLNKYDGKSFTVFTEEHGLPNSEIWSLWIDSDGMIWIGHNEGLSRFDGNEFKNIAVPKPAVKEANVIYSPDRITGIIEDKEGNLWLGTDGFGICRYNGKTFTHFTTEKGLCDNTIYELMLDRKGNIWIGTFFGGVSKYDGKKFTNYTKDKIVNGVEVSGFFEDNNGDVWFGVENNGVYRYDGNSFSHYYKKEGLDALILSIYRDKENRFWFGGWGGLFRYDEGSFRPVTKDGPWE
ncbi:ligand-binding sensor domain-containing protein [Aureispira anguillae]|uniref:Two component regulator propeller n=1 Tax=Aureispira anguillae TaxID=2864201 RepID=A0A915YGN8_9BACT|nr:two-component regulator propeller domain-containing protein [Aureispira anguillae]BDS12808.1 hypothetical protein AsAng_0035330 [Aureispira anguillae]